MKPVNRVLLAFQGWEDRKNELQPMLRNGMGDERTMLRLQLEYLQQANHRLSGTVRPDERPFMALMTNSLARLEKQLYPSVLQRLWIRLKDRFIDGPAYLQNLTRQRESNMEDLKQQLRDKGLGSVAGKLEHHLDPDHKQVCLPLDCQLTENKRLNYDLWFEKDVYGNFHWTRLDGSLLEKDQPTHSYEFELKEWPGLKANQAWSLLEGRALKQTYTDATGHENQRWVELGEQGVQHYAAEHPFDVATAINAMPQITRNREELIRCLENGQQVPTHWKHEGQFQNIFVQADPANNNLKLFDAKGKPITAEQLSQRAKQRSVVKKPEMPAQRLRKGVKNGHHY